MSSVNQYQKLGYSLFLAIIILLCAVPELNAKAQYVQPLNWGMNMCLPYDIANLFKRPIAGVLGVFTAGLMAVILFFGVITAPFGYMFGIPSRKYVIGGDSNLFPPPEASSRSFQDMTPVDYIIEDYGNYTEGEIKMDFSTNGTDEDFQQNQIPISFEDNVFYFLPKMEDQHCRKLVTCLAHGSLQYFPRKLLALYKLFSRKLTDVPTDYREAIVTGFKDSSSCRKEFESCTKSPVAIIIETVSGFLPKWTRRKAQYNTFSVTTM